MLKIAFYRAEFGKWYEKLISWYTLGPFSHVELIFDDQWFSSSPRDGGVRYKEIFAVEGRWEFIEIKCNKKLVKDWCDGEIGKQYDWRGFFNFVLPIGYSRHRWFCSEICVAALQKDGLLAGVRPHVVSPNDFYRLLGETL